jgi:hypothetical protein
VDLLPLELLADFDLPLVDDIGRFAKVLFTDNDFSSFIPVQRNHDAASFELSTGLLR